MLYLLLLLPSNYVLFYIAYMSKIRNSLFDQKEPAVLIYIGGVANSIRILLSLTGKVMKDRMLLKFEQNSFVVF